MRVLLTTIMTVWLATAGCERDDGVDDRQPEHPQSAPRSGDELTDALMEVLHSACVSKDHKLAARTIDALGMFAVNTTQVASALDEADNAFGDMPWPRENDRPDQAPSGPPQASRETKIVISCPPRWSRVIPCQWGKGGYTIHERIRNAVRKIRERGNVASEEGYGCDGGSGRIVYVVDRSRSMETVFDEVRMEILTCVSKLEPPQQFHVIMLGTDTPIEIAPHRLVEATGPAKLSAVRFLNSDQVQPGGRTSMLPALKRAFQVLGPAKGSRPKKGDVIILVTDGLYEKQGNQAILAWLKDNNADGRVRIHVTLYEEDSDATNTMERIAEDSGGRFRRIQAVE